MQKRIIVLIDSENISQNYIEPIYNEISKYGKIIECRAYRRLGSSSKKDEEVYGKFYIKLVEQFSNKKKNLVDMSLIIDGVDLLHSSSFEILVVVSGDNDFIPLYKRAKESGKEVFVVVNENNDPESFSFYADRYFCIKKSKNSFLCNEVLNSSKSKEDKIDEKEKSKENKIRVNVSKKEVEKLTNVLISKLVTKEKKTTKKSKESDTTKRGRENEEVNTYPTLSIKDHVYVLLKKFLEEQKDADGYVENSTANNYLKENISSFSIKKDFGYSRFSAMIRNSFKDEFELSSDNKKFKAK